jgi:CO/xanthine dehydrogenase Mo-binding subunit
VSSSSPTVARPTRAEDTQIGSSVRRVDGEAKVRGAAVYCMDYEEAHMLHAGLLRSPVPAGRIARLDLSHALALPGVRRAVTSADAPRLTGLIVKDQGIFARDVVRYAGEPVAAVAAETPEQVAAALAAIELEIDPLPASPDLRSALNDGAPLVHPGWESYDAVEGTRHGNLAWEATLNRGDIEAAFTRADITIVEDEFEVPRQHQSYIEPRGAVARFDNGRYVIHSSTQFPFLVRDRVAEILGVRSSQVRIVVPTVGGGFGGKLDSGPEPYCALLAQRTGRPVKLVYTRTEEFVAATMRENAIVRIRSAVTRDGDVVGQEALCLMDAGAYSGETPIIAALPGLVFPSAYRFEIVHYTTRVAYTNTPPTGAMRGVCGPYIVFALERHLDNIANELGLDRRALRVRSAYRDGDRFPNGQELGDVGLLDAFDRIEQVAPWAEVSRRRPFHGVGLAAVTWLTNPSAGSATVKLHEDGTVGLVTAATEIGSGAVAAGVVQIVASELGISPDDIVLTAPDTDVSAYDGGAQGSRTLFHAGNAARLAAQELREQVLAAASELLELPGDDLELFGSHVRRRGDEGGLTLADVAKAAVAAGGPLVGTGSYASPSVPIDADSMTGAFFTFMNAPSFHVHLAEVEVDPDTGKVTIVRYVVAQDVGKAINPMGIEGQIEGGVLQGIGYALYEDVHLVDGHVLEHDLENYRLPTAGDAPPIEIILLEHPSTHGPYGAKGAGEPPIVPVAAAVANAVSDAIGRPLDHLPITPYAVLAALREDRVESVATR